MLYRISESDTFYYQETFRTDIHGPINEVLHFQTISCCFFVTSPWPCHSSDVSLRLTTTASLVQSSFRSCGIYGGRSSLGASSLRVSPSISYSTNYSMFVIIINIRCWYSMPTANRRTKRTHFHPSLRMIKSPFADFHSTFLTPVRLSRIKEF